MQYREELRNVAIIAHIDHGKTTLVDALFKQGGIYRSGQHTEDRVMDSNDQEKERGITILAKPTSVTFGEWSFQLVDTPGHADFGGEVERALKMVDGVLLLVDAAEGPLPQTRFVLRKAFDLGLPVVVVINKIDRQDARPEAVLDEIYSLFIDLGADDAQLDFPVVYAVARNGTATLDLNVPGTDLKPLVEVIRKTVPAPVDRTDEPFVMQVNQIAHDSYVGRLAVGRVLSGKIKPNSYIFRKAPAAEDGSTHPVQKQRVTGLFKFQGVQRLPQEEARCGDIIALSGIEPVSIGDTLCESDETAPLEIIAVEEPTVAMIFQVNDGPLSGQSGKYVTSRHLRERLMREAYANVSIKVEDTGSPESLRVLGRGELQLAVLIESMRREGYEMCVRPPQVVVRQRNGIMEEPRETLVIDVPMEHLGAVNQLVAPRRGVLRNQSMEGDRVRIEFSIPTRGLLGLRGPMLTRTRGTAIMCSSFETWAPFEGEIVRRASGALVSDRLGTTTPYALFNIQPRGIFFIPTATQVYTGMIVGEHNRDNDLYVNVCREKKLSNVRAAGKDENTAVAPHKELSLEQLMEWIRDDEMIEITPDSIRARKVNLKANPG